MTTVIVEDEVFQTYKAGFKADAGGANAGPKLAYMILGMTPDFKRIALLKTVARDQNPSYDDFVNEFPAKEPRWAVYFFEFEKEDGGGKREKICYFSWWVPGVAMRDLWKADSNAGRPTMLRLS